MSSKSQNVRNADKNMSSQPIWLWGTHAVMAAIHNPKRQIHRLMATKNATQRAASQMAGENLLHKADLTNSKEIDRILPSGAVHQGLAALCDPLPLADLQDLLEHKPARIAVLDQISDPHNLGAIVRSAAAFDIAAIILQTRHSPPMTGIVAKSAAGAIETVKEVRVVNIARALDKLSEADYTIIGLSGQGDLPLAEAIPSHSRVVLVFGAEGAGLRPSVAKACHWQAKIPITPAMESLNISNAAAIAFYDLQRLQNEDLD